MGGRCGGITCRLYKREQLGSRAWSHAATRACCSCHFGRDRRTARSSAPHRKRAAGNRCNSRRAAARSVGCSSAESACTSDNSATGRGRPQSSITRLRACIGIGGHSPVRADASLAHCPEKFRCRPSAQRTRYHDHTRASAAALSFDSRGVCPRGHLG